MEKKFGMPAPLQLWVVETTTVVVDQLTMWIAHAGSSELGHTCC